MRERLSSHPLRLLIEEIEEDDEHEKATTSRATLSTSLDTRRFCDRELTRFIAAYKDRKTALKRLHSAVRVLLPLRTRPRCDRLAPSHAPLAPFPPSGAISDPSRAHPSVPAVVRQVLSRQGALSPQVYPLQSSKARGLVRPHRQRGLLQRVAQGVPEAWRQR